MGLRQTLVCSVSRHRVLPHALDVRSGVTRFAKPCLRAPDCAPLRRERGRGLKSKFLSDWASLANRMLRFASCRASSRTFMCAPESRQSRSLAYERRAVPYRLERSVLNVRSGVAVPEKPCLGAAGCGLESRFRSDAALHDETNTVIPEARRAIRGLETTAGAAITRPAAVLWCRRRAGPSGFSHRPTP